MIKKPTKHVQLSNIFRFIFMLYTGDKKALTDTDLRWLGPFLLYHDWYSDYTALMTRFVGLFNSWTLKH